MFTFGKRHPTIRNLYFVSFLSGIVRLRVWPSILIDFRKIERSWLSSRLKMSTGYEMKYRLWHLFRKHWTKLRSESEAPSNKPYNTLIKTVALNMWSISSWLYCSLRDVFNTCKHLFALVNLILTWLLDFESPWKINPNRGRSFNWAMPLMGAYYLIVVFLPKNKFSTFTWITRHAVIFGSC